MNQLINNSLNKPINKQQLTIMYKLNATLTLFFIFMLNIVFTFQSCKENDTIEPTPTPSTPVYCNTDLTNLYNLALIIADSSAKGMDRFSSRSSNYLGRGYLNYRVLTPLPSNCISKNQYYDFFDTTTVDIVTEFPQLQINPNKVDRYVKVYRQLDSTFAVDNSLINRLILAFLRSDSVNRRLVIHMDSIVYNSQPVGTYAKNRFQLGQINSKPCLRNEYSPGTTRLYLNYIVMEETYLTKNFFALIKDGQINPQFGEASSAIQSFNGTGYTSLTGESYDSDNIHDDFHRRLVFEQMPGHSCGWDRSRKYEWIHDLINNGFYIIYDGYYTDPIKVRVTFSLN